jgi:hypothetical protein
MADFNSIADNLDIYSDPVEEAAKAAAAPDNAVPGTILKVKICLENWELEGDNRILDCGAFEIDSCDFEGPPDSMNIKAVSTPVSSSLRREEKSNGWENTTLKERAQDIASNAELQLMYEVEGDINLDRVDQLKKSDLSFLQELCNDYGVSLKVTNKKLVLFDESAYEKRPSVDKYDKNDKGGNAILTKMGRILAYSFSQNTTDCVSKVQYSYKDPKSGELVECDFEPPNPPSTGQILKINERPGDLSGDIYRNALDGEAPDAPEEADGTFETGFGAFNDTECDFDKVRSDVTENALRKAKARAREKNKNEWTGSLTVVGNPKIIGGVCVDIAGFGVFNGKYMVDEASHTIGGGYTTEMKLHRVLEGY